MDAGNTAGPGLAWLTWALMTVASWGVYGIFLHTGQTSMGDPVNGRYKAFLLVGVAYVVIAVLAPMLVLKLNGATWSFPARGVTWSLLAGAVGAIGAFGVLLAFGAKGSPAVVMSIVFAGAPVVNAMVSLAVHPPARGWAGLRWQFLAGIALAALGGCLVTLYKPVPGPPRASTAVHAVQEGSDGP